MPRIFDNIDQRLLPALQQTLDVSTRADFCVGYFNLRGWAQIDSEVERWKGRKDHVCRLLVGMQQPPQEQLKRLLSVVREDDTDQQTVVRLKKVYAEAFRAQLTWGCPTNRDELALRRLAKQIKAGVVTVKLFLRHPLHAKLYLLFRPDAIAPIVGYLGSSNLTFSGLSSQGELNVDVLDHDAAQKLAGWFEDRWNDRWCLDISSELVEIIEQSWAGETLIPPYHIYVKMAYHLAAEARAGLSEFQIPKDFGQRLFAFQTAAVKIAAHHLNRRGGVLIGDVVGLGKTLMATALARIFELDHPGLSTLIICPKNLVKMWQAYADQYGLRAKVLSLSRVEQALPEVPARFRLVLIDESHNLRNRLGKRYRAIQDYIEQSDSRVILLSATPYNKTYLDLSSQLRLFLPEHADVGIRPERFIRERGELELQRLQIPPRSLAAFERSDYPDDWRDLMRLFLVRRTRSFIQQNYAQADVKGRKYLLFEDGSRAYFPQRMPKTLRFRPDTQYRKLYADTVLQTINALRLPRYGLGNYTVSEPWPTLEPTVAKTLRDLSRAGKRLMGFCRTNLFKRLESSGWAFILSLKRHIVRNAVTLYALNGHKAIPVGTQDASLLDPQSHDEDAFFTELDEDELGSEAQLEQRAAQVYETYATRYRTRFKWLDSALFQKTLAQDLERDNAALKQLLARCGVWHAKEDEKLRALWTLLTATHPEEKVLVFTQFADTVHYLEGELGARGLTQIAGVSGRSSDPTALAWRFSPESNGRRAHVQPEEELRVLVSTDVLSEGQNLQDCAVVVNYDLPWAIIRLVQRAGRVDRIGQKADRILCYSFWPADGVERVIHLRTRVQQRLHENAEVVGTDEAFFEDEADTQRLLDLYHEKASVLDDEQDGDNDLTSQAYEIWKRAIAQDPRLETLIPKLPPVVHASKSFVPSEREPAGVLVYMRTAAGNDALAWVDHQGRSITESQTAILRAAACQPNTPALPHHEEHYTALEQGLRLIAQEDATLGGQLGRPAGARYRTYERLKAHVNTLKDAAFIHELDKVLNDLHRYPLRSAARDTLNRQLRSGIGDPELAEMVCALRAEDRLSIVHEQAANGEPQIICSLGLIAP